ncbi:MAG: ABC transporter ATP-binding protein [Wenzhouxiangella sp.]|jgi:cobalt/nickel transport system ATP-binding protein|nr:ABC transporter ATP-binding protein [Wenzhouxiangella sp.]
MIELEGVGFRYPDGGQILQGLSFELTSEERVVLLGANGCGKSSLLKLIDGLLFPTAGEIRFEGEALSPSRLRQRDFGLRFRRDVGMVFQSPEAMLFNATVAEEIAYGPERLGMPDSKDVAKRWAARLQLEKHLETPPYRLSGGEKQRLALACVLACQPKLLLLDEPTANLDPRATGWLVDFLLDQQGLTTLVTTQNLSLAAELGKRALILGEDGRLLYDGPLDQALQDTDLLWRANLAHAHRHVHADGTEHRHVHVHKDWG